MKRETFVRRLKRRAMRDKGLTFTERVMKAIRTGKPVEQVSFK